MSKIINFLKKKKYLIYLLLFIALMILAFILSKPKKKDTATTNYSKTTSQTSTLFGKNETTKKNEEIEEIVSERTDVYITPSYPDIETAEETAYELEKTLPIYIKNFETSVGIKTIINIYTSYSDPKHVVHLEIYGINYQNMETDFTKNPNVVAFKESFYKALSEIEKLGLDPRDMYYVFGTKEYVQETANHWVKELDLLNY